MLRVVVIGTGNIAHHLFDAFSACLTVDIVQVIGRNAEALGHFEKSVAISPDLKTIVEADVCIVAVSDDAISTVYEHLTNSKGLIVHTSGSVSIDVLPARGRRGVFYPLQTFSKGRKVDFKSVPICLEAYEEADLQLLKKLAGAISRKVYEINSEQRKALHNAAVVVNNFTNHLYYIGQRICDEKGVPFEILQPLIRETADKIEQLTPYDAQTGPARRGDSETISTHLEQLKNSGYQEVYEVLSESILKLYRS